MLHKLKMGFDFAQPDNDFAQPDTTTPSLTIALTAKNSVKSAVKK